MSCSTPPKPGSGCQPGSRRSEQLESALARAAEAEFSPVTPERVADLNERAATFYEQACPGSWAQTYLTDRLGGIDLTGDPRTVRPERPTFAAGPGAGAGRHARRRTARRPAPGRGPAASPDRGGRRRRPALDRPDRRHRRTAARTHRRCAHRAFGHVSVWDCNRRDESARLVHCGNDTRDRITTLAAQKPAQRWAPLARQVDPALVRADDWGALAETIDRTHRAGGDVATLLPRSRPRPPIRASARHRPALPTRRPPGRPRRAGTPPLGPPTTTAQAARRPGPPRRTPTSSRSPDSPVPGH